MGKINERQPRLTPAGSREQSATSTADTNCTGGVTNVIPG
jgi:hypothetical protein